MAHDPKPEDAHDDKFVKVSISTTSGFFPAEGSDRVPINQHVEVQLKHAQKELKIKDTTGWVATVINASGRHVIDPGRSYADNNLAGIIEIDWGPSEGGGG
jgi:hypothetical protein